VRFSAPALAAGLLAGFVGYSSSFAVVLQGLTAMGEGPTEAASGLSAVTVAMGLCGVLLSYWRRMPISVAWSTPGAALLAASAMPAGGFPEAVGAFLACGGLIVLAGLWPPLGRWVAAIPPALANAMLAGVLFGLCLAPVKAVAVAPFAGLAIIFAWAVMGRVNRLLAVPAAVLVAAILIAYGLDPGTQLGGAAWPMPVLIAPQFSLAALAGIALPLFLVTMASQNIPGMAVLNGNGYRPAPGPLFAVTGLFSLLAAPFGGHAVNLAAITAALCANPDAEPDPARRWQAAAWAGAVYCVFGLLAGIATRFVAAAPPVLVQAVAGLALLGAFGGALQAALNDAKEREAAVITFLVTASGLTVFGISGAFWGLLAGGAMRLLARTR
jgi:benzoate membrane transport protein